MPSLEPITLHSLIVLLSWINFHVICIPAAEATVFPCIISAADILSNYQETLSWVDTRFRSKSRSGRPLNFAEIYAERISPGLYSNIYQLNEHTFAEAQIYMCRCLCLVCKTLQKSGSFGHLHKSGGSAMECARKLFGDQRSNKWEGGTTCAIVQWSTCSFFNCHSETSMYEGRWQPVHPCIIKDNFRWQRRNLWPLHAHISVA